MGLFGKLFGKETEKGGSMKMEPSGMKEPSLMASASKVNGPVCGMDVDPKNGTGQV